MNVFILKIKENMIPLLKRTSLFFNNVKKRYLHQSQPLVNLIRQQIVSLMDPSSESDKKFWIISFSDSCLVLTLGQDMGDRYQLLHYEIRKLWPQGTFDRNAIAGFIKNFRDKHAIASKDVILNITESDSTVLTSLSFPVMPEEEILSAARWQLKELVPFDLSKAAMDWRFIREFRQHDGTKNQDLLFIVMKEETLASYVSLLQQCQLTPVSVVNDTLNYPNLLKRQSRHAQVCAILDITYSHSMLAFYIHDHLAFVRFLPVSWEKIIQSLTQVIPSPKGQIHMSLSQAEDFIVQNGIPPPDQMLLDGLVPSNHVLSLMRPLLEVMARDMKFSMDYFMSHFNLGKPDLLYLTGYAGSLAGFDQFFGSALQISMLPLDIPVALPEDSQAPGDKTEIPVAFHPHLLAGAIGAGLDKVKSTKLLPLEVRIEKSQRLQTISLRLVIVALGLIYGVVFLFLSFQIRDYEKRLSHARIHLKVMGEISSMHQQILEKEELIRKLERQKVPPDGLLKLISSLIPPEIILDELSFDQRDDKVILKGYVAAREDMAESLLTHFMEQMESSPFFTEATLVSLTNKNKNFYQPFEIGCHLVNKE